MTSASIESKTIGSAHFDRSAYLGPARIVRMADMPPELVTPAMVDVRSEALTSAAGLRASSKDVTTVRPFELNFATMSRLAA